jgi:hypothetical protein
MFPICHAVSGKLTWTHYRTLITVENEAARQYYFEEAVKSKWSVRYLQRQISTQFYQRLIANYSDLSTAGKLVKRGKVEARDIGQMQLYKHYYEREIMNPGDNPPIGIVLGSDRDEAVIRYTLNEHERNLFAVKYHLNLPTVEELQMELMRERAAIEEAMALRSLPPPESKKKSEPRRTSKGDK